VPSYVREDHGALSESSMPGFLQSSGPGIVAVIAFIDPGNLKSDLSAGLEAGLSFVWILALCTIVAVAYQLVAAHVGLYCDDLATLFKASLGKHVAFALWIVTEAAIIAAEAQAQIGAAIAVASLLNLPLWGRWARHAPELVLSRPALTPPSVVSSCWPSIPSVS
jgi:manganese transport protein